MIGIGNLLMTDDGIGIHVINELQERKLPPNIEVYDGQTIAFLVLEQMDGMDKAVIIDAYRKGEKPGTIYKFRVKPGVDYHGDRLELSLHDMDFMDALRGGAHAYDLPDDIVVIGVEPETLEMGLEPSQTLKDVIPDIIKTVLEETK